MTIEEAVQEASEHFNNPPPNESNTCDWVTLPLLYAAGYARHDINSRVVDNNGQYPDYTVLADDPLHTWFVEAKAWNAGLKDNHAQQALNYANQNGKRWVVLTNGHIWNLYDNSVQGFVSAKQVLHVLLKDVEAITEFLKTIGKQSVCSDQLESTAYAIKQRHKIEAAQTEEHRVQSELVQPFQSSDSRPVLSPKSNSNFNERLNRFWQLFRQRLQSKGLPRDEHKPEWSNRWFVVNKRSPLDWFYYVAEENKTKVEYVLNNPVVNHRLAHSLFFNKEVIEQGIGAQLDWPEKFDGQKYIIRFYIGIESFTCPEEHWPAIQEEMISKMLLLQKALAPFIEAT